MTDLQNSTVLITRPPHKAEEMADLVRQRNGRPVIFPTIRIGPPADWTPVDLAIRRLPNYDWVIFTSSNGVRFFTRRLEETADLAVLQSVRVAAVGAKTADTLGEAGITADVTPSEYTAGNLLDTLMDQDVQDKTCLLVLGDKARNTLSDGLKTAGARVEEVIVYRNTKNVPSEMASTLDQLRTGRIRVLTFTSPSTFQNFLDILTELAEDGERILQNQTLAAIGPVTARAIQAQGFRAAIVPEEYTIEGMLDAAAVYLDTKITTHG